MIQAPGAYPRGEEHLWLYSKILDLAVKDASGRNATAYLEFLLVPKKTFFFNADSMGK